MSLQFYFGPSGSGKSRRLYQEMTRRAREEPNRNFLVIVPDQFTMQTQKDLVLLNPRGGIMNIDVLSFGRLGHRILEEAGGEEIPVLDDTGKSLVLQKVASKMKEDLPALGSFLHRQGYVHEVKSAISEFMQYGISPEDVTELIACAEKRGALARKLEDLQKLYRGFLEYIKGNYITTEETLDVLRVSLPKSALIPDSVVVFDGFTGFTPIQNRVIRELMRLCGEVIVTLTLGEGEDPYQLDGEQKLFHLSKKTVADLSRLAEEVRTRRKEDVFLLPGKQEPHRFQNAPALKHLERYLFRYRKVPYENPQQEIGLFETSTPRDEVHQTGLKIRSLLREEGMAYRDIAVIVGDLAGYAPYVETEFAQMDIPCFIDRTRGILLNPMIEYIKSAIALYEKDFSYEAVFHYLRSGLADMEPEETDLLENYVLQTGIRGYRAYSRLFVRKTPEMQEDGNELAALNGLRERLLKGTETLHMEQQEPVKQYVEKLYDFLVQNQVQEKLDRLQKQFQAEGKSSLAREYAQIYRLVMELLDQIYRLLGEEIISLREFADILEAGFGEIQVGTIPQNVDRVVVGDMERTRLKQVKALFFLGVNDGNIPKSASKGGIISDMDREFLRESHLELAPSPRQQMYIQRLYLYLNMTKPSERLYLSYSRQNSAGKALRPAYLIDTVKELFPGLTVEYPQLRSPLEQIVTRQEGAFYLARELREYAAGTLPKERERGFFTLYRAYGEEPLDGRRETLLQAAFRRYEPRALSPAAAEALYGKELETSVTRLETYAACACRHFLQYGLNLREREGFSFETVDMGNVYHEVLRVFAAKLQENRLTWFDFDEGFARAAVKEAVESCAAVYGQTVLYSSARNVYAITRMERVLTRTVLTLQRQLQKGSFRPDSHEVSFRLEKDLESVNFVLPGDGRMRLTGRIDRIDVDEDGDHVYVKVVDYKSGDQKFDLAALYYGLQMQLAVYMNAGMELERRRHPGREAVPAALLYYHIDDPAVDASTELTPEEIDERIAGQLRMNGVVNADPGIVSRLDHTFTDRSEVIPVERKKDGGYSARCGVVSGEDLQTISGFVNRSILKIGGEILGGVITANPFEKGGEDACAFCAYKKVCGFETSLPGCAKRRLEELDRETALQKMREEDGGTDPEREEKQERRVKREQREKPGKEGEAWQ